MAYDNGAIVRRLFNEAWTKGDLGVVDELVDGKCVSRDPIMGETTGTEALKAQIQGYRSAFPDLRLDINDLVVSADKVVAVWTATGTHRGAVFGEAPTGKAFSVRGIDVHRIRNGKIVEHGGQWDTLKFLQNIGLVRQDVLAPKATAARAEQLTR